MDEIKSCPFCGNAPSLLETSNHSTAYSVECLDEHHPYKGA